MKSNIRSVLESLAGRGITHVGLPWYEASDYAGIKSVMEDGDRLPITYDEWQTDAEELEEALRGENYTVVRALIRSIDFVQWCRSAGYHVNAQGRNHFASLAAVKGDGKIH